MPDQATATDATQTGATGTTNVETKSDPATILFGDDKPADGAAARDAKPAGGDGKVEAEKKDGEVEQTAEQKAEAEKQAATDKLAADVKALTDAGFKKNDGETDEAFAERAGKEKAEKDKAEKADLRGAPETYDLDKFTVAEGLELDKDGLKAAEPLFKELDLSQKGAQKLVDFYAGVVQKQQKAQQEAWTSMREGWQTATRTDKEIGGDKLDENIGYAKAALKEFGTPELLTLAETTAVGDNVEFIRSWSRVGRAISEAKLRTGKAADAADVPPANRLFPGMK